MLRTCWKPARRRMPQALALRTPLRQWITMSDWGRTRSSVWNFAQRDQSGGGDMADLVLVRLAHVDRHEMVSAVESGFHFGNVDFAFRRFRPPNLQ